MKANIILAAALLVAASGPRAAAQDQFYEIGDTVRIGGGVGYSFLKADEIVYDGAGNRISHLFWESQSPTVTGRIEADFANGWSLRAGASFAFAGTSMMRDYDWIDPYFVSYAFDDWTHRSQHPGTQLAHYFAGDIAVGKDMALGRAATLNLHGGLSYTDVRWNGYGGPYIYSDTGYRADTGTFPEGVPGISFQQRYPGVFLGASLAAHHGPWTFSGQARGGVSVRASGTDHHWMRDMRFEDTYGLVPFVTATARLDYAVSGRASLFLSGDFQQFFHKVGDSANYSIATGAFGSSHPNGAGMALQAMTVSGGFRIAF